MAKVTKAARKKRRILAATALVLAAAITFGLWFGLRGSGEAAGVYNFEHIGMTEYWGDSLESYGPVTTDRIQTLFLSDTQTVTEVLVKSGDAVKKGDILVRFDTTLSGLQLERKRLDVEKAQLQLDAANAELRRIRNLKPMQASSIPMDPVSPFQGATLTQPYKTYLIAGHDGKTMAAAFICWLHGSTYLDDTLLEALRQQVWQDPGLCRHGNPLAQCTICNCTHGGDGAGSCEYCTPCVHGVLEAQCAICNPVICQHKQIAQLCPICTPPRCIHNQLQQNCPLCSGTMCQHGVPADYCKYCCMHGTAIGTCPYCCQHGLQASQCSICSCSHGILMTQSCSLCGRVVPQGIRAEDTPGYSIQLLAAAGSPSAPDSYYVIFKVTEGNTEFGAPVSWLGAHVQGVGKNFSINYFTPVTDDYSLPKLDDTSVEMPDFDMGSGLTAAQIAELRKEQEKKVKELAFAHKMADAEYKIMERELGDGNIYAEFDGTVVSLLTPEESRDKKQPMVKISGGGGFYIEGSVSELEKDRLLPGQEVTVNDWNSGSTYTGTVKAVGDFPSQNSGWTGMGNPTATYYPFTVFVSEEADLREDSFVSIQYAASGSAQGIYLDKAFVRTEQGQSYVYVLGQDGCLEKRYVKTGKSLWGRYIEVLSNLRETDKLAFPYDKHAKHGAKAEERDVAELYNP